MQVKMTIQILQLVEPLELEECNKNKKNRKRTIFSPPSKVVTIISSDVWPAPFCEYGDT